MSRWQYGVARTPAPGHVREAVTPVAGRDEALALIAMDWPNVQMYRRPYPKPWRLVPVPARPEL